MILNGESKTWNIARLNENSNHEKNELRLPKDMNHKIRIRWLKPPNRNYNYRYNKKNNELILQKTSKFYRKITIRAVQH